MLRRWMMRPCQILMTGTLAVSWLWLQGLSCACLKRGAPKKRSSKQPAPPPLLADGGWYDEVDAEAVPLASDGSGVGRCVRFPLLGNPACAVVFGSMGGLHDLQHLHSCSSPPWQERAV